MEQVHDSRDPKGDECGWEDTYISFGCALGFDAAYEAGPDPSRE